MNESDIMHESQPFWVMRKVSTNAAIAPIGSLYYQIFKNGICASESTSYVTASLARAIATCDNMARISSPAYKRIEKSVARSERAIRGSVK